MADANWEKAHQATNNRRANGRERWKFLIGGVLILGAVGYLIVSGTLAGASYFISVNQLVGDPQYVAQNIRITGAVLGETIEYDSRALRIEFTIANIPENYSDLAQALHEAANDPQATRLQVVVENQVKPDLLQHEAQAILTGRLGADGIFYASELLLKCPTRFEEVPGHPTLQAGG